MRLGFQLQAKKLEGWRSDSLRKAKHKNMQVVVLRNGAAYIDLKEAGVVWIVPSLQHWKLCWALTGCIASQQHYTVCTAHAVQQPSNLICTVCWCIKHSCDASATSVMCKGEQEMLRLLCVLQLQENMCWQVAVTWWEGRIDFQHMPTGVFIQVDGACHERGIHGKSREEVSALDLNCCLAAYEHGAAVVRVRVCEIDSCGFFAAALQLAAPAGTIVLSTGFSEVQCMYVGRSLAFPNTLALILPSCRYSHHPTGWHVFINVNPEPQHSRGKAPAGRTYPGGLAL